MKVYALLIFIKKISHHILSNDGRVIIYKQLEDECKCIEMIFLYMI